MEEGATYNDYIIIEGCSPLEEGDAIVLTDGSVTEYHTVETVIDSEEGGIYQTLTPIMYQFQASDTRVVRVRYPSPIEQVAARLAASYVYDKYFASQSSPNTSEYGKEMRKMAMAELNSVISGSVILHGAKRIGHRFLNPNLRDQYTLPYNRGQQHNIKET